MRKFKLILCLILSVSLISVGTVTTFAAEGTTPEIDIGAYKSELEFLSNLGITDGIETTDYYRTITRAEFVSMVVKMLNISHTSESDGRFTDVSAKNPYISSIYTAFNFGLLKGTSDTTFSPDMPITYAAAVKILVSALGYEEYAYVSGGYPIGYIMQADSVGILDNVDELSVDTPLSFGTVVTMISNSLTANIRKIVCISDEYVQTSVSEGENCLTQYFKLTHITGVVTTAGYYSMIDGYNEEEPMFEIGDTTLDCPISGIEKYLGYDADAWYDAKTKKLAAVRAKNTNNTVTVDGSDIDSFSDFKVNVIIDEFDNTKSYSVDKGYTFVLNGRTKAASKADFSFENGTLTLIDNNGDRRYDVVVSNKKTYVVVRGINTTDKIVYDKNRSDIKLVLDDSNGYHYNMYLDGEAIDFSAVQANMVLEVAQSADGFLSEIVVCTETKRGTITALGTDTVYIDDVMYKTNEYFEQYCNPEIGQSGIFLLDTDGRITFISNGYINSVQYGYFLDLAIQKGSLSADNVQIKLFTDSGNVEVFTLTEKIKLDGKIVYINSDEWKDKLVKNVTIDGKITVMPIYQLIRFGTDANGLVNLIDTASDVEENSNLFEKYAEKVSDNSLTRYVKAEDKRDTGAGAGNAYWRKVGNAFAPYFTLGNTTIIKVPTAIITNRISGNELTGKFDDSAFSIASTGSLPNYGWYYVDAYDYDDAMTPKIVVMYKSSASPGQVTKVVPDEDAPVHLVEKVIKCINDEGIETKRIYSYSNGGFQINDIAPEVLPALENDNLIPEPGEAIRISNSSQGVNGIARDVICDSDGNFNVQYGVDGVNTSVIETHTYVAGKVFSCSGNSLVIQTDEQNYPTATNYPTPIDNLCGLRTTSNTVVAIFNKASGVIEHASTSDISDIRSVGEADASYVCIALEAYGPKFIIIYR